MFNRTQNGDHSPWTLSPFDCHRPAVPNSNLKELGNRIRERRKLRGWTQEVFADEAQIDRSYVGGIERGERNITFTVLCQLCAALKCDVADLTKGLPLDL